MTERNSLYAGALRHLVIEATKVVDSDFIPFHWLLIAFTVLHDFSRKTHCEPSTRIANILIMEMLRLVKYLFK